jgi:mannose-6-phosphate isomerase-like protein (cupin superfamily)
VAKTSLNHKVGFMDKTGNEIVPPKYDDVWIFHEGLASVSLNGKDFYIKVFPNGKIIEYYDD